MPDSPAFYEERIRLLQAENQEAQEMLAIEQRNGNDLLAENQRLRDALTAEIAVLDGWVVDCCGDEQLFCDNYGCSTIREISGTLRTALNAPAHEVTT